ncbi:MAG: metallophosphoesterase [Clostridia bacterium]|nr:metallophosphoesterase [Clostridia bacterium]
MKKLFNKKAILTVISVVLIISIISLFYGNFSVDVQEIHVFSEKLPESFHNYLIAHISDYHNRTSAIVDKQIIDSLNEEKPDIIVITGDLIDSDHPEVDVSLQFTEKLCEIAPVYYVTGNHESNVNNDDVELFNRFIEGLTELGVNVLRNDKMTIQNSAGDSINICGIEDPYFYGRYDQVFQRTEILCNGLDLDESEFNVLLAHHPETLSVYYKFNIDLVLSGHAHGGQVTFFGRAIMAPDQVTFPPYTSGLYKMGDTQLVLSRGIGYSLFPIRVFCRPHLVYAELKVPDYDK